MSDYYTERAEDPPSRLCFAVTQSLRAGDPAIAASLLQQQAPRFEAAGFGGFIHALQAIVAGSRDRTLADAPDMDYGALIIIPAAGYAATGMR